MPRVDPETAARHRYDICVVGGGVAGLALALAARAADLSVLVVERGGLDAAADPCEPEIAPGVPHDPGHRTGRQGLGGTLNIWGGRCVPFDRADFAPRPGCASGWPIAYEDYARWIAPAARLLGVEPVFERPSPPHWPALEGVRLDTVERLGPSRALADLKHRVLARPQGPDVLLDSAVRRLAWSGRSVSGVEIVAAGSPWTIPAGSVVLACGGLQTTRLLLIEDRRHPGRIVGRAPLGRTYMGHLTGSIAEITFASEADAAEFAYDRREGGSPARRRFLMTPEATPHIALWVENVPGSDPRHRSGELSIKALARGPRDNRRRHLANICTDPVGAAAGLVSAARTRLNPRDRYPNRLIVRGPGPYRLAFHAEHLPLGDSRVTLAEATDVLGMHRLRIDFAYGDATVGGTVSAHRALAATLEKSGLARLALAGDDASLARAVAGQARDGYHQIGLTRMGATPDQGVVDREARVHGTDNLYVASASVFPVASQANPTLSVVAFALRLAASLASSQTPPRDVQGRCMTGEPSSVAFRIESLTALEHPAKDGGRYAGKRDTGPNEVAAVAAPAVAKALESGSADMRTSAKLSAGRTASGHGAVTPGLGQSA